MALLDLDELPQAIDSLALLSRWRVAPASYCRTDHLGPADQPLSAAVRALVRERTGMVLHGPVRLLTQLRYCGYYFSPLNLYYCMDREGQRVDAVVAEVSNTPWRQRHYYVLWEGNRRGSGAELSFSHPKDFHVSPFIGMAAEYRWRLSAPGRTLSASIAVDDGEGPFFAARMAMVRRPLSDRQLGRLLLRYPLMTARTMGAIYFQALKLWLQQCPLHPHPDRNAAARQQAPN